MSHVAAERLYSTCLAVIGMGSLLVAVLGAIAIVTNTVENNHNIWLISVFGIAHAICACSVILLNYHQNFRIIAILNLTIPLVFIIGAINIRTPVNNANTLLFWQTAAYSLCALLSVAIQSKHVVGLKLAEIRAIVSQERANLQYLVPSSLLSILALNISVIGAMTLFNEGMAGLVVIAQRIARAPVSVIGNSLNEVLRASIPSRHFIMPTFKNIALICLISALCMVVGVYLLPESVYAWVLGQGWDGIRLVMFITVTGACFQLIGTSVFSMLTSFNKRADFLVNLGLTVCGLFALVFAYYLELSAISYLWTHTILIAGVYLIGFTIAYKIAKNVSP